MSGDAPDSKDVRVIVRSGDDGQPTDPRAHELLTYFARYFSRVMKNVERATRLVALASVVGGKDGDEILRASVVLLHATFEDFLRVFAVEWLTVAPAADTLAKIPMVGSRRTESGQPVEHRRGDKYDLGHLVEHRHKTVDAVIGESVRQFYDRKSFSNMTEVTALIEQCGWKADEFKSLNGRLDALMARRHRIAHRADVIASDSGETKLEPIASNDVEAWIAAVSMFFHALMKLAVNTKFSEFEVDIRPNKPVATKPSPR